MALVAIQFGPRAMLRVAEVEFIGLCKDCGSRMAADCMADITRGEIASVRGRSRRVTLEAGRVCPRTARNRERYTPTGRLMTCTTRNIRMPGVIKSGAETLQASKRLNVGAFRFRTRVACSAYRVFQSRKLL